ncbi:hypothetical protein RFI_19601, partial [Reticulomyxa filosa]
ESLDYVNNTTQMESISSIHNTFLLYYFFSSRMKCQAVSKLTNKLLQVNSFQMKNLKNSALLHYFGCLVACFYFWGGEKKKELKMPIFTAINVRKYLPEDYAVSFQDKKYVWLVFGKFVVISIAPCVWDLVLTFLYHHGYSRMALHYLLGLNKVLVFTIFGAMLAHQLLQIKYKPVLLIVSVNTFVLCFGVVSTLAYFYHACEGSTADENAKQDNMFLPSEWSYIGNSDIWTLLLGKTRPIYDANENSNIFGAKCAIVSNHRKFCTYFNCDKFDIFHIFSYIFLLPMVMFVSFLQALLYLRCCNPHYSKMELFSNKRYKLGKNVGYQPPD